MSGSPPKDEGSNRNAIWEFGRQVRKRIVGVENTVTLFDGEVRPYVNLDNAATTPAFRGVVNAVVEFLESYGSVHRGSGVKSRISSEAYEQARATVGRFVGADPEYHSVIFTSGTTTAINKLARTLAAGGKAPTVLYSLMEHHSNLLPWRKHCHAECIGLCAEDGGIDLSSLDQRLAFHKGGVRLVAITGASNVTGLMPPIKWIARIAHAHGAELLVDGAQLVPHRSVRMGPPGRQDSIDYLAFSGHKVHAPFGIGVLVGPRESFKVHGPECVGGGAVKLVTPNDIVWEGIPGREESGTPNVIGAVALAKAIDILTELGMEQITGHDRAIRTLLIERLKGITGIRLYGESDPCNYDRVGVVSFTAEELQHGRLAAALGHEAGIGARHGCFCADPYVAHLLGIGPAELQEYIRQARHNDRSHFPGLVRVSTSAYNTPEEIDYLAHTLRTLLMHGPRLDYVVETASGEYSPTTAEGEARARLPDFYAEASRITDLEEGA